MQCRGSNIFTGFTITRSEKIESEDIYNMRYKNVSLSTELKNESSRHALDLPGYRERTSNNGKYYLSITAAVKISRARFYHAFLKVVLNKELI